MSGCEAELFWPAWSCEFVAEFRVPTHRASSSPWEEAKNPSLHPRSTDRVKSLLRRKKKDVFCHVTHPDLLPKRRTRRFVAQTRSERKMKKWRREKIPRPVGNSWNKLTLTHRYIYGLRDLTLRKRRETKRNEPVCEKMRTWSECVRGDLFDIATYALMEMPSDSSPRWSSRE